MLDQNKTKAQLIKELEELRTELDTLKRHASDHGDDALYWLALSNIADAVFVTDESGQLTFVCPNVSTIFGYSVKEVSSMGNITTLLMGYRTDPQELTKRGEIENREIAIVDKAGETHILLVNIKRITLQQGSILYTCRDITAYKQLEAELGTYQQDLADLVEKRTFELTQTNQQLNEKIQEFELIDHALRQSEEKFHAIVETAPVAIIISNREGRIVMSNFRAETMFGYTRHHLAGSPLEMLLPEQFRTLHPSRRARFFENPRIRTMGKGQNLLGQRKDGAQFPIEVGLSYIESGQEMLAISFITDISQREKDQNALRASEQMLQLIINHIPQSIFWKDVQFVYLGCNQHCATNAGLASPDEIVGKTDFELAWRDHAVTYRNSDTQVLTTGEPILKLEELRYPAGDIPIWGKTNRIPIFDAQNQIVGILGTHEDITERRQMEEALRFSAAQYRSLFEDSPNSLWVEDFSRVKAYLDDLSADGVADMEAYLGTHPVAVAHCALLVTIHDVNQATLDLYQANSKEELLGGLSKVFVDEALDTFREELLAFWRGESYFQSEIVGQTLAGEIIHCIIGVSIAPGYEDGWEKVFVFVTDITARKQTEAALLVSEERYRAISELTSDFAYALRIEQLGEEIANAPQEIEIEWMAGAVARITGYPPSYFTSYDRLVDIVYPDDRKVTDHHLQILNTGMPTMHEFRIQSKNGNLRWLLSQGTPVWDKNHVQVTRIYVAVQDVTERRYAYQSLYTSEERFRTLVEASPDAIVLADINGKAIMVNQQAAALYGYDNDEDLLANITTIFDFFASTKHFQVVDLLQKLVQVGTLNSVEIPMLRRDGTTFLSESSAALINSSEKKPIAIVGIVRDITDRKQIELEQTALIKEQTVLEERQRLARELHDAVSQTLFSANIIAEMTLHMWDDNKVDQVRQNLGQLQVLTRGAQAEMRMLLLELRPAALGESTLSDLLRHLVAAMTSRAGAEIILHLDEECDVATDIRIAFYRIAQEALNNTVKHARATIIHVNLQLTEEVVLLTIRDNGLGFDIASVPRDRLGLQIMRERAQAIGADFQLTSTLGQGVQLMVRWPES